jgi:DNA-binding NarL/FixJ family response regulator
MSSFAPDVLAHAQTSAKRIEVVVAVQPPLFHDVLRRALDTLPGFRVFVGDRGEGRIDSRRKSGPRVLLLDEEEFERSGYQIIRRLRGGAPATRLLVIAMQSSEEAVARVLRAGACGLVELGSDLETLARAIRAVAAREVWANGRAAAGISLIPARIPRRPSGPPGHLTEREWEIADGVAQGLRNKEIAVRLNISQNTVKNHLNSIFRRLKVESRVALGMWARFDQRRSPFSHSDSGPRAYGAGPLQAK